MQFNLKNILKALAIPFGLLALYAVLFTVWKIFDLPPQAEMISRLTEFIIEKGLIVIFIGAFIEGVFFFGVPFPGGTVILIGVAATAGHPERAVLVVLIVCVALFLGYLMNYFMGKYGWYKLFIKFGLRGTLEPMQKKLSHHAFTAILSSYWLPNLAALCSTAAGIMHIPLQKFLIQSAIGVVIWNTFWGIVVYMTGTAILGFNIVQVLLVFLVWSLLILGKVFVWDKRFGEKSEVKDIA